MTETLREALRAHFGFDEFLPGQEQVIAALLAGESAAAVFPTGGGKSLCYQLPALLLPGLTLVVSPLLALMKDQIDALSRRGIAAGRLDSTQGLDEYARTMQRARDGGLRLLYVAPERFQNERFREAIVRIPVSLFAVDEAHCISEWGHAFRPDYLKLAEFARQCRAERMLALTATATPKVLDDVCRAFGVKPENAVRNSCYRPNLTLLLTPVESEQRDAMLARRLRERPAGPTVVYVTQQKTAEKLAATLAAEGFSARPYHAGMEADARAETQDWFMQSAQGIVVATIAFGMGIDKADIRFVYHCNPPKSLENYAQEIGRAGRDGKPATCETLYCADDLAVLENFALGDTPTRSAVDRFVSRVFGQGLEFDLGHHELGGLCDMRLTTVRTLLAYLELDGWLEGGTPYYSVFKFKARRPSHEILAEFEGERREFLARLFRQAKPGRIWLSIDAVAAARELGEPRERIVRALDHLGEKGWLELEVSGTRHRYRTLRTPPDVELLAASLHKRCVERERHDLERLRQVVELVEAPGCQVAMLCAHFGETREKPCGHCTRCLGAEARSVARSAPAIDKKTWAEAMSVRRANPATLKDPMAAARWLCGVASPSLTRAKLSAHPLFGSLADCTLAQVRDRLAAEFV